MPPDPVKLNAPKGLLKTNVAVIRWHNLPIKSIPAIRNAAKVPPIIGIDRIDSPDSSWDTSCDFRFIPRNPLSTLRIGAPGRSLDPQVRTRRVLCESGQAIPEPVL